MEGYSILAKAFEKLEEETIVIGEATVADIDRLDSLGLADYATDYSMEAPEHDGRLPDAELDRPVSVSVDKMR